MKNLLTFFLDAPIPFGSDKSKILECLNCLALSYLVGPWFLLALFMSSFSVLFCFLLFSLSQFLQEKDNFYRSKPYNFAGKGQLFTLLTVWFSGLVDTLSQTVYFLFPLLSSYDIVYLLKVNNRNTRTRCEICLKLTINQWRRSGIFIVNSEDISHLVLAFLLLTLNL